MKTRLLTLSLILFGTLAMAQEKMHISTAIIAYEKNEFMEAKKYIDLASDVISSKAASDVDDKQMSKFLYYKGEIYFRISQDTGLSKEVPDALDKAYNGWTGLVEYEKKHKQRYTDKVVAKVPYMAQAYLIRGYSKVDAKDYKGAKEDFLRAYEINKSDMAGELSRIDTSTLFNAAIMAENAKELDQATELYRKVLDMGYKGITYSATSVANGNVVNFASRKSMENAVETGQATDPVIGEDTRPDIYLSLFNVLFTQEKSQEAMEVLAEGRKLFPNNKKLAQAEVQIYLNNKEYDKALKSLRNAIRQEPDNKLYYYVMGSIYQQDSVLKNLDSAKVYYKKAIEIDPNYVDALYNYGTMMVDEANKVMLEMNNLPLNATSKYNKLNKKKEEILTESLGYFEKVYEIDPKDNYNLNALAEVYQKLGQYEKAMKIKEEMKK
ncbi:MAG: tetratricopeptide repeat protein [Bacteroidota bacterium]|nr:tetratricopeptide repeat protein [Bacteroidota bacterium]